VEVGVSAQVINSAESLQRFIGDIRQRWNEHKFLRVNVKTGKDRSLDQNAISHCWYEQVSRELREDTTLGVKRYCKLHFGVPILRAEDAEFRAFYDVAIKMHLTYEEKLQAMDLVPVTSRMSVKQLSQYLEVMQAHYAGRGVALEFLEEGRRA
jgi:hypothetical protein